MSNDIKQLLERHYKAWSTGDVEGIVACFTDDSVFEDLAIEASFPGKEGVRAFAVAAFDAIPDFQWTPKIICVEGSIAVAEWHMTGTHKGEIPGIGPGTGKTFSVPGMTLDEIKGGLIHRHRDYWNVVTYQRQVGLLESG